MDWSVLFFVGLIIILVCRRRWGRSGKLPPGPYPLPIIGNILQLGSAPHESLAKLPKTYGPLMSLKIGSVQSIVISSPEMVREVLQKHGNIFTNRTLLAAAQAHDISIGFLPVGDQWRKLRKISQEHMFTSSRLEASQWLRREKLEQLLEYVEKHSGRGAMNVGEAVFTTTLNLTSATLFSVAVADFDSEASQGFRKNFEDFIRVLGSPNVADFFPFLQWVDPQGILRKSHLLSGNLLAFIQDIVNRRLESRHPQNDLLATLIHFMDHTDYKLTIQDVTNLLLDFLVGGADTVTTAIEWTMTELLLNPNVMAKAKHELRQVIGEKKEIQESDISRLPYLQAVIKEVFRFRPPAAFMLPREPVCEVEVCGYTIPKGTLATVNLWAISSDPNVWSHPDTFRPERFLDSKIDLKGQHFELTPFGSGRRICPGVPLANRVMHITVATLIHNFDWVLEGGMEPEFHTSKLCGPVLRRATLLWLLQSRFEGFCY